MSTAIINEWSQLCPLNLLLYWQLFPTATGTRHIPDPNPNINSATNRTHRLNIQPFNTYNTYNAYNAYNRYLNGQPIVPSEHPMPSSNLSANPSHYCQAAVRLAGLFSPQLTPLIEGCQTN
jgi:hypothetical protein